MKRLYCLQLQMNKIEKNGKSDDFQFTLSRAAGFLFTIGQKQSTDSLKRKEMEVDYSG